MYLPVFSWLDSSLLLMNNFPLYGRTGYFTHSFIDGPLGCFQVLVMMKSLLCSPVTEGDSVPELGLGYLHCHIGGDADEG